MSIYLRQRKHGKDNYFDLTNEEIYCSELIYFAYKDSYGKNIFNTTPMTFIDANTNETHIYWQKHFNLLGIPIPEGKKRYCTQ